MEREITIVNSSDRDWTKGRYILAVGDGFSKDLFMIWADHLEDALDACVDYLEENDMEGIFADDYIGSEVERLISEGMEEDEAFTEASVDHMSAGNHGRWLSCDDWLLVAENPTRAEILELQGRA